MLKIGPESSSSSSRSHLMVGSLRQTQFSSGQFCHRLQLLFFFFFFCCADSSHVSVDIVHPSLLWSLLWSSSSSSPGWCRVQRLNPTQYWSSLFKRSTLSQEYHFDYSPIFKCVKHSCNISSAIPHILYNFICSLLWSLFIVSGQFPFYNVTFFPPIALMKITIFGFPPKLQCIISTILL